MKKLKKAISALTVMTLSFTTILEMPGYSNAKAVKSTKSTINNSSESSSSYSKHHTSLTMKSNNSSSYFNSRKKYLKQMGVSKKITLKKAPNNSVTVKKIREGVYNIFGNGNALILAASNIKDKETVYSNIYIDKNADGKLDSGDEEVTLDGISKFSTDEGSGYNLMKSYIYAGSENDSYTGDTKITITGGEYWGVYGGGKKGTINGNTSISMTNGWVASSIFGGGESETATVTGNTQIHVSGGHTGRSIGGGNYGPVIGNSTITVTGGEEYAVWGADQSTVGNVTMNLTGGNVYDFIYGGGHGVNSKVGDTLINFNGTNGNCVFGGAYLGETGATKVNINSGNIRYVCGGGCGKENKAVSTSTEVNINGGNFYDKDANGARIPGGFIFAGGECKNTVVTGDSTLNINTDDFGNYYSAEHAKFYRCCPGSNKGTVEGNAYLNLNKNYNAYILSGETNSVIKGNMTITVSSGITSINKAYPNFYIDGMNLDGNNGVCGTKKIIYDQIGEITNDDGSSNYMELKIPTNFDEVTLKKSKFLFRNAYDITAGDPATISGNLYLDEDSKLDLWHMNPVTLKGNLSGAGTIILDDSRLTVNGTIDQTKITKLMLKTSSRNNNDIIPLIEGKNIQTKNFKLLNNDYELRYSNNTLIAQKKNIDDIDITMDKDTYRYGDEATISVKVTQKDSIDHGDTVEFCIDNESIKSTATLDETHTAQFKYQFEKAGTQSINVSYKKDGTLLGVATTKIKVEKFPLTIKKNTISISDNVYSASTIVKMVPDDYKNAELDGYRNDKDSKKKITLNTKNNYYGVVSTADVGQNKSVQFKRDKEFELDYNNTDLSIYNNYYVAIPKDLTVNITPQIAYDPFFPSVKDSLIYGQKLKDAKLSSIDSIYDYKWKNPEQIPEVSTTKSYPFIATLKPEFQKNYCLNTELEGYDKTSNAIIRDVIVPVIPNPNPNASSNYSDYTPSSTVTPSVSPSNTPAASITPTVVPSAMPSMAPSTQPSNVPEQTQAPSTKPSSAPKPTPTKTPDKGTTVTDKKGTDYKVVSNGKTPTVAYQEPAKDVKGTVSIPSTTKVNGVTYKVTEIAQNAFKNETKITKIETGENVKTICDSAFSGCTNLKTVFLGKNVTSLGDKAFANCESLTKVTIPSKVQNIGDKTFAGCKSLTTVSLPSSVTKIGAKAFTGCDKLKTITIKSTKLTTKNIDKNAFAGISENTVIKVPASKYKKYVTLLRENGLSKKVKIKKIKANKKK